MAIKEILAKLFNKKPPENPGLHNFLNNTITPTKLGRKKKWPILH